MTDDTPIGNVSPECAGPHEIARSPGASSGSVAVTANETTAPAFEVAVAVASPGAEMTGAVVSRNVSVSVHVFATPASIVMAPPGPQSPEYAAVNPAGPPLSETVYAPGASAYLVPAAEPSCGLPETSVAPTRSTWICQSAALAEPPLTTLNTVSVPVATAALFVSVHVFLSPPASVTFPDASQSPENVPVYPGMSPVSDTVKVPPDSVYVFQVSEPACGEFPTSAPAAFFTCSDQRAAEASPPTTCLTTVRVGASVSVHFAFETPVHESFTSTLVGAWPEPPRTIRNCGSGPCASTCVALMSAVPFASSAIGVGKSESPFRLA